MDHPNRRKFLGSAAGLGFTMGFDVLSVIGEAERTDVLRTLR
jgi:hypothetical protein